MGEKSLGASLKEGDNCGDVYAEKQGTCVQVGFSIFCPDGAQSWDGLFSSCPLYTKCCISETTNVPCTTKLDGDKCVLNGERKTCKNGFCGEQECKTENTVCSKDGKTGTCKNSKCDTSTGNTSCSIEGTLCSTGTYTGICFNGTCSNSGAKAGEICGIDNAYCGKIGCEAISYQDTYRFCNDTNYVCCKNNQETCGTNAGTCKTDCDDKETEDTTTPKCNTGKCCYTKYGATDGTTPKDFKYKNPLYANTFTEWAETVLTSVQSIVGWLAVIMLMVGGIVYLTSAGTNQATLGKDIITAALIGFAVVIAGPSLLKEIKDIASTSGSSSSSAIDSAKDIKSIITSVLEFLLASMGTLALIGFAVGGVFYLTAFGDKGKAETGKKMAINSLYAIALAGGGLILVNQILSLLGN